MHLPATTPAKARMPRAEARACLATARQALHDARLQLLELYERQGWHALGYQSWREFCEHEFTVSTRHLYRLIAAAQVERDVTHGSPSDETPAIPERQLRELARVDTAEIRREIWEEAQRLGVHDSAGLADLVDRYLGDEEEPPAVAARLTPRPQPGADGAAAPPPPAAGERTRRRWPDRLRVYAAELRAWHPHLGGQAPAADRALDRYLQTVDG